jgi:hypothetical protein
MRRFRSIVLLIILTGATSPIFPQSPPMESRMCFGSRMSCSRDRLLLSRWNSIGFPRRVTGKWIGKDLAFFKSDNPKIWYALAGADLETQPGTYDLTLTTDFPVNEGAPVVVSNSGTVVLAKELFYEGNCVIVDHGHRFFAIYMHLSKLEVKPGNKLGKDERLGLFGQTGRVTGPHLHMGVRGNGAYLDPTKLLGLTLPNLGSEKRKAATRVRPSSACLPSSLDCDHSPDC